MQLLRSENDNIRIVQLAPTNFAKEKLLTYSITNGILDITDHNKTKVGFSSSTDLQIYCPEQTFEKLSVQCTSESITGVDLKSKTLEVKTTAGDIDIDGIFENIESDSNQNILIFCEDMPKNTLITGTVSDTVLKLPENNGFTLFYDTASGDIESDFPLQKDNENYIYKDGSNKINVEFSHYCPPFCHFTNNFSQI